MKRFLINIIKLFIPIHLLKRLNLIRHFCYDYKKYRKHAGIFSKHKSKENIEASITRLYHGIEKGLSHPNLKLGFGKNNINLLIKYLMMYKNKYNVINTRYVSGVAVVFKYIELHKEHGYDLSNIILEKYDFHDINPNSGGHLIITKKDVISNINNSFIGLFRSRYSIREFSNEDIDINLVKSAISLSIKTPSVCNRQDWKVKIVNDESSITKLLSIQNGFRGYNNPKMILVLMSDIRYLDTVEERNQGYIDGGMFSMSLMLSLHSCGLATCALNAAMNISNENRMRDLLNTPDNLNYLMFLIVGNYPETFKIALSYRDSCEDILI